MLLELEPASKLPFLFAVYTIVWIVFFIYAFFLSKHQSELEREIRELKKILAMKENETTS